MQISQSKIARRKFALNGEGSLSRFFSLGNFLVHSGTFYNEHAVTRLKLDIDIPFEVEGTQSVKRVQLQLLANGVISIRSTTYGPAINYFRATRGPLRKTVSLSRPYCTRNSSVCIASCACYRSVAVKVDLLSLWPSGLTRNGPLG